MINSFNFKILAWQGVCKNLAYQGNNASRAGGSYQFQGFQGPLSRILVLAELAYPLSSTSRYPI